MALGKVQFKIPTPPKGTGYLDPTALVDAREHPAAVQYVAQIVVRLSFKGALEAVDTSQTECDDELVSLGIAPL